MENIFLEIERLIINGEFSFKKVAKKLGAKIEGSFTKNVKGKEMEHLIYKLFMVN